MTNNEISIHRIWERLELFVRSQLGFFRSTFTYKGHISILYTEAFILVRAKLLIPIRYSGTVDQIFDSCTIILQQSASKELCETQNVVFNIHVLSLVLL